MRTPAEVVFVLPNNKNIIMAAEQSGPPDGENRSSSFPSKTVPQGISAMLVFDPDASEEDNLAAMTGRHGRCDHDADHLCRARLRYRRA